MFVAFVITKEKYVLDKKTVTDSKARATTS